MQEKRLALTRPEQFKALGHPIRWRILGLLGPERDATITQLAASLESTKGAVGHHVNVLAEAGLIELSRTRPVGGVVEKYWRRTAPGYELADSPGNSAAALILKAVLGELRNEPDEDTETMYLRRARVPRATAFELKADLEHLSRRIDAARVEDGDDLVDIGVLLGIYRPAGQPLPPAGAYDT